MLRRSYWADKTFYLNLHSTLCMAWQADMNHTVIYSLFKKEQQSSSHDLLNVFSHFEEEKVSSFFLSLWNIRWKLVWLHKPGRNIVSDKDISFFVKNLNMDFLLDKWNTCIWLFPLLTVQILVIRKWLLSKQPNVHVIKLKLLLQIKCVTARLHEERSVAVSSYTEM